MTKWKPTRKYRSIITNRLRRNDAPLPYLRLQLEPSEMNGNQKWPQKKKFLTATKTNEKDARKINSKAKERKRARMREKNNGRKKMEKNGDTQKKMEGDRVSSGRRPVVVPTSAALPSFTEFSTFFSVLFLFFKDRLLSQPTLDEGYRVPSFTGFYWVLPSFTGFYWVLLGFIGFYWVLPSFTGFYWVLPSFT